MPDVTGSTFIMGPTPSVTPTPNRAGSARQRAVLYHIRLVFGELYEEPTGRAFSSWVKCLWLYDRYQWSGLSCFVVVVVIVIVVVVVIRRRS